MQDLTGYFGRKRDKGARQRRYPTANYGDEGDFSPEQILDQALDAIDEGTIFRFEHTQFVRITAIVGENLLLPEKFGGAQKRLTLTLAKADNNEPLEERLLMIGGQNVNKLERGIDSSMALRRWADPRKQMQVMDPVEVALDPTAESGFIAAFSHADPDGTGLYAWTPEKNADGSFSVDQTVKPTYYPVWKHLNPMDVFDLEGDPDDDAGPDPDRHGQD